MNVTGGEDMAVVYADVLFLINFCMILFILLVLRMFLREKKNAWLCFLAAAVGGGGYILISFWDGAYFLRNTAGYSLLILLCGCIAYLPGSLKEGLRLWGLLYVFTFIVGGICSGIFYFSRAGVYIGEGLSYGFKNISLKLFLCSVLISYALIKAGLRVYENRVIRKREYYTVELRLKGKRTVFTALGDTGNGLKDSISGKTVLAAEYDAVKGILPEGELLKEDLYKYAADFGEELKLCFVPYKSLGNDGGLLPCFTPELILINGREYRSIIIGISFSRLSSEGSFKGLINTEALISEEVSKNACKAA